MSSPSLNNLAAAAESGTSCPRVTLLTSGWLVSGVPISARQFMDATNVSWGEEILASNKEIRKLRDSREQKAALKSVTHPMLATVGTYPPSGTRDDCIHLGRVSIVTATGPVVTVTAVQIALAAVSAWWATSHGVIEGKQGLNVGVGFAVPF